MQIKKVSFERYDIDLTTPYVIAYETISKTVNFILKVETETTHVGFGCAAPDEVVTGETAAEVEAAITEIIIPFLIGKTPFHYMKIITDLKVLLGHKSSALAMVDMALYDLIAKRADLPLYQLLGGFRHQISTSITLGIVSVEESLKQTAEFVQQGFTIVKVKGGLNVEEDIEKMLKLHERFPRITWRFDGNQGYNLANAVRFVTATEQVGIEIFEQPTSVSNEEKLGQVTQEVSLPVMADESLKTLKDAFRLAQNERIDMVNIKLMKVGGITEGLHINSVAKAANLETMVGCIDECSLGIAAGLHFALSRPNIRYADLDGHLDMINDPFKGLFTIEKGVMIPSIHPGIGKVDR